MRMTNFFPGNLMINIVKHIIKGRTLKVLILAGLIPLTLFSQTNAGEGTGDSPQEEGDESVLEYGPTFYQLKITDKSVEMNEYETIKNIVKTVEETYLKRLVVVMEDVKKNLDDQKKYSWKEHQFTSTDDYFRSMVSALRGNKNLYRGVQALDKAWDKYLVINKALEANGVPREELDQIEYKMLKYRGMFNMYYGTQARYLRAIKDFEYIMERRNTGTPLIENDDEYIEILNYLAGCHHQMYVLISGHNTPVGIKHLRAELYALWQLTGLKNKDKPELLDYKYRNLIRTYYTILDPNSDIYDKLYEPYVDKVASTYQSVEEKVENDKGESGSVDDTSSEVSEGSGEGTGTP